MPRLRDMGVRGTKLSYEREDTYVIYYHGKGIPMGHTLLAMQ